MTNNLPTLAILHYVYGALICFAGFAALAFLGVGTILQSDLVMQNAEEAPPLWLGTAFQAFGAAIFVLMEAWGIMIILSGRWLSKKKNRTGSIIMAALCLLSFPFGTALGIFTLVVLMNEDVKMAYDGSGAIVA